MKSETEEREEFGEGYVIVSNTDEGKRDAQKMTDKRGG
jgi:hypothetical protein